MNEAHKIGKLRNRLMRLKKKVGSIGLDRAGMMNSRITEIEDILRQTKK